MAKLVIADKSFSWGTTDDRTEIQQSANVFVAGVAGEKRESKPNVKQIISSSASFFQAGAKGGDQWWFVLQGYKVVLKQGAGVSGKSEIEQSANAPGCLPRILPPGSVHCSG